MAKANLKAKHGNGKQNGVSIKSALELIVESQGQLYALREFGEAVEKSRIEGHALQYSIAALCEKTRGFYWGADQNLPEFHPARGHLRKAGDALETLEFVVRTMCDAVDGVASPVFRQAVARCVFAFVGASGRWMERAELELDSKYGATCGWLTSAELIDGGDGMGLKLARHDKKQGDKIAEAARAFAQEVAHA